MSEVPSKSPAFRLPPADEAGGRKWSSFLCLWLLCSHAACRRTRACRGNPLECHLRYFPLLPESVRDWYDGVADLEEEGVPPLEAVGRLLEEDDAIVRWWEAIRNARPEVFWPRVRARRRALGEQRAKERAERRR